MTAQARSSWYSSPRFFLAAAWIVAGVAGIEAIPAILAKDNDFAWHQEHGADFLAGDPYIHGADHYLVPRLMMDALLAILPARLTRALLYTLALVALVGIYRLWNRLAHGYFELDVARSRAAAFFAALILLPFLLRDLDECGLQIFLLFFLTAAAIDLSARRSARAGFWIATAIAYKTTPLLALPFLLWKRQWRAAGWTAVFLAAWAVAPALFLGWDMTVRCHARWWQCSREVAAARHGYPELVGREVPNVRNLSLQAAIDRYLEHFPADSPLHLSHPLYFEFGNLPPLAAYYTTHALIAALGLLLAWRLRRPWRPAPGSELALDWAVLCVFCALLSPLCWKQHLVLALPCVFLATRGVLASSPLPRVRVASLVAIGLVVLLSRHWAIGQLNSLLMMSYKFDTYAILLAVGLLVTMRVPKTTERASQTEMFRVRTVGDIEECEPARMGTETTAVAG